MMRSQSEPADVGRSMPPRLVLFAHGSRDERWRLPFVTLERELQERFGAHRFRLAYMEFAAPTLMDRAIEAVRDGVPRLRVLPLFFAAGAHVARDIPAQIQAVRGRFPALQVEQCRPVGEDPRFTALLLDLAHEACEA